MSRVIRRHIIHCSDSPDDRTDIDAAEIKKWHLNRGFKDIGYHFVILRDGDIEGGRPLKSPGAHCEGHNHDSIGTCLVGRKNFDARQLATLKTLHKSLQMAFPGLTYCGHRDLDKQGKTCPNLEVRDVLGDSCKKKGVPNEHTGSEETASCCGAAE